MKEGGKEKKFSKPTKIVERREESFFPIRDCSSKSKLL